MIISSRQGGLHIRGENQEEGQSIESIKKILESTQTIKYEPNPPRKKTKVYVGTRDTSRQKEPSSS